MEKEVLSSIENEKNKVNSNNYDFPTIEVTNSKLQEAIKLVLNSKYPTYADASPVIKTKVQDLKNLLVQISNGGGNLSKIKKILNNINYEIIFTLKPVGEVENISGFPTGEFEKLLAANKIKAAEDLLFKEGRSLPSSVRLKLETKLEEAKPLNLGTALIPLKLTLEALERVMEVSEDNTLSDKVCGIIYRDSLSEKLIDILKERLDYSNPEDKKIRREILAWKSSLELQEVEKVEEIVYRDLKIAIIDYKVYARLNSNDTTLVDISDLFETTFLREVCLKKNQHSFKVTELVRAGGFNKSIVVSYKKKIYRTFSGEPDSKYRKIGFKMD